MADFTIELTGEQFRRAYLLYVIEICHYKDRYYYVGQTGDRNYITARPAFRRLSGHLEDRGTSTQNQIYKYIVDNIIGYDEVEQGRKYDEKIKQAVEEYLTDSKVIMYIYRVHPFDPMINDNDHHLNVSKTIQLERNVIKAFIDSGKSIMNKSKIKSDGPCPYPDILERIISEFGLY